jgi:hypothetical protein
MYQVYVAQKKKSKTVISPQTQEKSEAIEPPPQQQ